MGIVSSYLRDPISNGNPQEQAMIRAWWHEQQGAKGRMVWEYGLEGKWADGIWFPTVEGSGAEEPGKDTAQKFPLSGSEIVLCEAKKKFTPEVIGQALVYAIFAKQAGAIVRETIVFTSEENQSMRSAAEELGLTVVVQPLD